jgi:hypothetical protein
MRRDIAESILLVLISFATLCLFFDELLLVASLAAAVLLVAFLVLRIFAWHHSSRSRFDIILILGAVCSLASLLFMVISEHSVVSLLTTGLLSAYYLLMARLLMHERWAVVQGVPVHAKRKTVPMQPLPRKTVFQRIQSIIGKKHDATFQKGVEPIAEMRTPAVGKMHTASFAKGVEPIHEFREPVPAKKHDTFFRRGIEQIAQSDPTWQTKTVQKTKLTVGKVHDKKSARSIGQITDLKEQKPAPVTKSPFVGKVHDNKFARGIEQIAQSTPSWQKPTKSVQTVAKIPLVDKVHEKKFSRSIEPLGQVRKKKR